MNLESLGDRYLLILDEEQKKDGIFVIPKDSRLVPQRGTVVGINKSNNLGLELYQKVYLMPNSGYVVKSNGREYLSVKNVEIIAKEI